ncbi:DUF3078 domain-containing protein [Polaribacter sp. Hel1_85]|uniref:DUF3078 domain-containing protein n=1 Tax=Polaribacter sp. Hel1_85 TaxID=1250005 RepID=UPI00052BA6E0|nr:DUF3078 domain-containing protein [Polaribacter sp. Hel1_85]KGL61840.1 hypothetical protein PHEL85_1625 [Polaribacter sp. Hel1_85]
MKRICIVFFILFSSILIAQKKKKDTLPKPKWKIHGRFGFVFNQSSFTNWSSGGENTIAGDLNVNYDFNYKKKNINWDTRILTGYGLSHLSEKGYRKTNDRFELNSLLGIKSGKNWFLSHFVNFKTQYTRGYNYKTIPEGEPVSDFLSPAYLSLGPGMLWKKSDDLNINIAPATARLTMVSDFFSGKFGVDEGKNTAFSLGFNLAGYFKFSLMENVEVENVLAVYSDYLEKPENIDIENQTNVRFKVNKHIKMHMTFHGIIDDNASSKMQFRQLFGLGLNYSFHQKVTY